MIDPLSIEGDGAGDEQLRALFAVESGVPPLDPAFVHAAMGRIAARRFWLNLLAAVPWVIAASAVLWAFAPMLGALGAQIAYWWWSGAPLAHGLARLIVLITPAAALLTGLVLLLPPHERAF